MKNSSNVIIKRAIFTALTVTVTAFIFINSAMNAEVSTQQSVSVLDMINSFFSSLHINIVLTDHIVRKTAHFTEYFILGALILFMFKSYGRKLLFCAVISPTCAFIVACIDENIQRFSEGRSCQFSDVMLDFSGALCAVLIISVILILKGKKRKGYDKIE